MRGWDGGGVLNGYFECSCIGKQEVVDSCCNLRRPSTGRHALICHVKNHSFDMTPGIWVSVWCWGVGGGALNGIRPLFCMQEGKCYL